MADRPPTVFRPGEKGLRKVFGDLEADIMEVVWRRGRVTVQDVWQDLKRRRLAYATVKTVMGRLAEKAYLVRQAQERAHTYEPRLTREEFLRNVGEEVLTGLFVDFGEPIRAHLVQALQAGELPRLERLDALVQNAKRRRR
ncbi:MAG: BlaI/MecI/CopY family transcriptional regulator [Candidatus Rokuibacteriota bacterium]